MSMGSGQALNIGLTNLDRPIPPSNLIPDSAALKQLKLFWLSVGNRDVLYRVAHGVHTYATEKGVPHIWRVDTNAHDTAAMSANFYHFAHSSVCVCKPRYSSRF
jgi:hypothetical protein